MKILNKKFFYNFLSISIIPLVIFEVFSQILYFKEIKRKAYLVERFISDKKVRELSLAGLHKPNQDLTLINNTLYRNESNQQSFYQKVKFRTDNFGTIIPSNIENIKNKNSEYIFFCGGSTLENNVVDEGSRITDLFSKNKKISTVNGSRSGKTLSGCIDTINYIYRKFNKTPKKIIIGTNINTFMEFSFKYRSPRKYLRIILPGLMQHYSKIRDSLKDQNQSLNKLSFKSDEIINLSGYEKWLLKGCCYGPSALNKNERKEIKWLNQKTLNAYSKKVKNEIERLESMRLKLSIPKNNIIIYIEPNSFNLEFIGSKYDYRQRIYSYDGKLLSNKESGIIANKYDDIYAEKFLNYDFKVIKIPFNKLGKNDFYDAAHLTKEGSKKVADFLSENL